MITENNESMIPNQSSCIQMIKGLLRPCGCSRCNNMDPEASHSHLCLHLHGTACLFRHLCRLSQQTMQQNLRPALQDVKLSPLKLEDFTTAEPRNHFQEEGGHWEKLCLGSQKTKVLGLAWPQGYLKQCVELLCKQELHN